MSPQAPAAYPQLPHNVESVEQPWGLAPRPFLVPRDFLHGAQVALLWPLRDFAPFLNEAALLGDPLPTVHLVPDVLRIDTNRSPRV